MTNDEARFILRAYRSGAQDADDAEFAEALAQMRRDPALAAWFEQEQGFDAAVAQKINALTVPAHLRANILAGAKVSRETPWFLTPRIWALAASIMLFASLGIFWLKQNQAPPLAGWQRDSIATIAAVLDGNSTLDAQSPKVEELQAWLKARNAPAPAALPPHLRTLASVGCKTIIWENKTVSIVCFHRADGGLVHLATVDSHGLMHAPPLYQPTYARQGEWMTVSWSEDGIAVMMFTRGSRADLQPLLGMLPLWQMFY